MKLTKKVLALLLAAVMVFALGACGESEPETKEPEQKKEARVLKVDETKLNVVIETELGDIHVTLNPEVAPITVANFQDLIGKNFYDGLTFHRVIDGFMIQGGDPNGDGSGGSPDKIKGEFLANGVNNTLSHERGVISMARLGNNNNSASSQFFIMHETATYLDGQYAAFGQVTEGMDVVDAIVENSLVVDDNGTVPKDSQLKINRIYFE